MPKAAALALMLGFFAVPAYAECTVAELQQVRAKIARIADPARRQEAQRLLDKAEKDQQNDRLKLCADALRRAASLIR